MKLYFNYTELRCLHSALKLFNNITITSVKKKQAYYKKKLTSHACQEKGSGRKPKINKLGDDNFLNLKLLAEKGFEQEFMKKKTVWSRTSLQAKKSLFVYTDHAHTNKTTCITYMTQVMGWVVLWDACCKQQSAQL